MGYSIVYSWSSCWDSTGQLLTVAVTDDDDVGGEEANDDGCYGFKPCDIYCCLQFVSIFMKFNVQIIYHMIDSARNIKYYFHTIFHKIKAFL